jgi:hypothetical protein
MTGQPWWYHFAVLGKSVGIAIGAGAGTAAILAGFVPGVGPAIAAGIGVVAGVASVVTHYADSGINAVVPPVPPAPVVGEGEQ